MKKQEIRNNFLRVRFNPTEYKKLHEFYEKTTARNLSEYCRDVLIKEPITVYYRNASADNLLEEMIRIKRELNFIGHNFNQVVKRLHSLDSIPEIRVWAIHNEKTKEQLLKETEE